jgi:hypothetical protein
LNRKTLYRPVQAGVRGIFVDDMNELVLARLLCCLKGAKALEDSLLV